MDKKTILIWIPLPEEMPWRGEGIGQTIEHIVAAAPGNIQFSFIGNNESLCSIYDALGKSADQHFFYNNNLFLTKFRFERDKSLSEAQLVENVKKSNLMLFFERYAAPLARLKQGLSYILHLYKLRLHATLIRRELIFRDVLCVWAPVPTVPYIDLIGKKLVVNFWDCFVLEYPEFDRGTKKDVTTTFLKLFKLSKYSLVLTQSKTNKLFLANLFGVPESKIVVFRLGCPDYSQYRQYFGSYCSQVKSREFPITLSCWAPLRFNRHTTNVGRTRDYDRLCADISNKATLLRLLHKISSRSKVITASTQDRPYKGLALLLEIISIASQQYKEHELFLVTTCRIPVKIKEKYPSLYDNMFEFERVGNQNHAFLYAISDIVMHPSFVEGGLGSYSMYEAASLDVPSLTNLGRHAEELCREFPDLRNNAFCDFTNRTDVHARLVELLTSEEARTKNVRSINQSRMDFRDTSMLIAREITRSAARA